MLNDEGKFSIFNFQFLSCHPELVSGSYCWVYLCVKALSARFTSVVRFVLYKRYLFTGFSPSENDGFIMYL